MKKYKLLVVFLISIFCFFLTACAPDITSGTVIKKEYNEPWRQTVLIPITHIVGKMTYTTLLPMVIFHEENWCITIQNTNEENKTVRRDLYVSEEVYNRITLNETYKVNGTESFNEPVRKVSESETTESDKAGYQERN